MDQYINYYILCKTIEPKRYKDLEFTRYSKMNLYKQSFFCKYFVFTVTYQVNGLTGFRDPLKIYTFILGQRKRLSESFKTE